MNMKKVQELVRQLLIEIGEDPEREGLLKTPERVARSMSALVGPSLSPNRSRDLSRATVKRL